MALLLNNDQTKKSANDNCFKQLRVTLIGLTVTVILGCLFAATAQTVQAKISELVSATSPDSNDKSVATRIDMEEIIDKSVSTPNDVNGLGRFKIEKMVYDYNEIKPYVDNEAFFYFRNIGKGPLVISEIKGCCGAVIKLDREKPWIYQPNEKGYLSVTYRPSFLPPSGNPKAKNAPFKKYLYIMSDDPNNRMIRLTVKGTVIKTMDAEPLKMKLFTNRDNCGARNLTLRALDGEPFSIHDYVCTGDCITLAYEPNKPAIEHVLVPTVDKEKLLAMKPSRGRIQINLDRKDYKNILIPFDLLPNYVVTPLQVFIFGADPAKKEVRSIDILDNYAKDANEIKFEIESIKSTSGAVKILSQDSITDGYRLKIEITPPTPKAGQTNFTDPLTIKLKSGEEFIVPARGFYSQAVMMKARKEATNNQ